MNIRTRYTVWAYKGGEFKKPETLDDPLMADIMMIDNIREGYISGINKEMIGAPDPFRVLG